jgi:hypothetical protein
MCQHSRVPSPDPHCSMNKKMVEIITWQTIMINNAQHNFFFKDKGKEMRLQIHGFIEKKKNK